MRRRIVTERYILHKSAEICHHEILACIVAASNLIDGAHLKHKRLEIVSKYITGYLLDESTASAKGSEKTKIINAISGADNNLIDLDELDLDKLSEIPVKPELNGDEHISVEEHASEDEDTSTGLGSCYLLTLMISQVLGGQECTCECLSAKKHMPLTSMLKKKRGNSSRNPKCWRKARRLKRRKWHLCTSSRASRLRKFFLGENRVKVR